MNRKKLYNGLQCPAYTLVIIILMIMVFVSCMDSAEKQKRLDAQQLKEEHHADSLALKVGVMPTLDCLPLFVAKEKNLFDTLGVDVRLKMFNSQMDCDTALFDGSVQGSITDLVRAERLQRRGLRLRYVAPTNTYWELISNRLSRVKELKQLGDKMLCMTRYSATNLLADMVVRNARPTNSVYFIQINDVFIRLKMLLNNEMDAMFLTEPQATTARINNNPVLFNSQDRDIYLGAIAFRTNDIVENRRSQQLATFVKAYDLACDSINKYGVKHYAAIIKKYCQADDKTIKALPAMKFKHTSLPRPKDIQSARQYLK